MTARVGVLSHKYELWNVHSVSIQLYISMVKPRKGANDIAAQLVSKRLVRPLTPSIIDDELAQTRLRKLYRLILKG